MNEPTTPDDESTNLLKVLTLALVNSTAEDGWMPLSDVVLNALDAAGRPWIDAEEVGMALVDLIWLGIADRHPERAAWRSWSKNPDWNDSMPPEREESEASRSLLEIFAGDYITMLAEAESLAGLTLDRLELLKPVGDRPWTSTLELLRQVRQSYGDLASASAMQLAVRFLVHSGKIRITADAQFVQLADAQPLKTQSN